MDARPPGNLGRNWQPRHFVAVAAFGAVTALAGHLGFGGDASVCLGPREVVEAPLPPLATPEGADDALPWSPSLTIEEEDGRPSFRFNVFDWSK